MSLLFLFGSSYFGDDLELMEVSLVCFSIPFGFFPLKVWFFFCCCCCRWSLWVWQYLQYGLWSGHCCSQLRSLQLWSQLRSLLPADVCGLRVVLAKYCRDYSHRQVSVLSTLIRKLISILMQHANHDLASKSCSGCNVYLAGVFAFS